MTHPTSRPIQAVPAASVMFVRRRCELSTHGWVEPTGRPPSRRLFRLHRVHAGEYGGHPQRSKQVAATAGEWRSANVAVTAMGLGQALCADLRFAVSRLHSGLWAGTVSARLLSQTGN